MVALLALVVMSLPFTLGFKDIKVDLIVTAGTETKVRIENDLDIFNSFDAQFHSYRVYLSVTPPGCEPAPVCYLVNSSDINLTQFKANITASVGLNDSQYAIAIREFSDDPAKGGTGDFQ
jgi:hypothetical protein